MILLFKIKTIIIDFTLIFSLIYKQKINYFCYRVFIINISSIKMDLSSQTKRGFTFTTNFKLLKNPKEQKCEIPHSETLKQQVI